jgi:hypothetical protein
MMDTHFLIEFLNYGIGLIGFFTFSWFIDAFAKEKYQVSAVMFGAFALTILFVYLLN